MASVSIKRPRPCQNDTDDDLGSPNFVFSGNDTFARFLVKMAQIQFKIKKDGNLVETNTLLLTFDRVNVPKSLKIFYRVVPVDVYIPNPLRCFNCQRFGHHENNCTEDSGSVCESRNENPQTDSIEFKISSKTPRGKKNSTKRHHHRHQKRQPGEHQFPKQMVTG